MRTYVCGLSEILALQERAEEWQHANGAPAPAKQTSVNHSLAAAVPESHDRPCKRQKTSQQPMLRDGEVCNPQQLELELTQISPHVRPSCEALSELRASNGWAI